MRKFILIWLLTSQSLAVDNTDMSLLDGRGFRRRADNFFEDPLIPFEDILRG